ncbi:golgin subfamily A member 6-like protein 6 [Ambystoma mexicanum]|uniref:golgin subfamily A member 6-like protein 6 n=1 Tax=Ambystoma mexicanum TaxID=8296 RepID=UPI0037E8CA2D
MRRNNLEINTSKTKVLVLEKTRKKRLKEQKWHVEDTKLELVDKFKYLGVTMDGSLADKAMQDQLWDKVKRLTAQKKQEIKEANEESPKIQHLYPIISGLLNHPQRKVPVVLKIANNDKIQKSSPGEKAKQPEPSKAKEKKVKKNKESQEDTPRVTNRDKMRSSPRSIKDFMCDTNLMNLSQHWETASNNSVIEVNMDQQTKEQKEPEKEIENIETPKAQTSKGLQEEHERQKRTVVGEQKKKREEGLRSPRYQRMRQQSRPQRIEASKSSEDHRRTDSPKAKKQGRQSPPQRMGAAKSSEDRRRTDSPKVKKQGRIFKVEQLDTKKGYMILNRKTILKLMSRMNSLKKIKTEEILLVEPYQRGKIAKAFIHVKETSVQHTDDNAIREMEQNGFGLTEIKRETPRDKKDHLYNQKGEREYHYTSRTEERYRDNRICKGLEKKGYDSEREYVRLEDKKHNKRWYGEEKSKDNKQSRNEHKEQYQINTAHDQEPKRDTSIANIA